MRIRKHTALISGLIALHVPSFAAAATRSPVRPPAKALTPPASFLQLCVASRDAPMEFRLYRLVDLLKENRRAVTWQRRGGAWIMRERWFDDLARRPHEIAFELTPMTGMATGRYCPKDRVEASVSRLVFDGVELTDMAFIKTLNAQTDAVYAADRPPPDVPSASTTP